MMKKTKVLIADDSALMRQLLTEILSQDPEIEVVGAVADAFEAREEIKRLNPDVLTLDVEMPKMDGISFLEKLMRLRPMPVVMISAMTEKGADVTMKALMLGAVDFITKPKVDVQNSLQAYAELICAKVKTAADTQPLQKIVPEGVDQVPSSCTKPTLGKIDVIAIGASTGGVEAIHSVLAGLPTQMPPILITQHIPPVFSTSFAHRLNDKVPMKVSEARNGMTIEPGNAYIAPGDKHLMIARQGEKLVCRLKGDRPVNRHMPSVEVLFDSVTRVIGKKSVGVLLTGMGSDGAAGLYRMKQAGAATIAQDKASSTVWGMPREAIEIGAVQHVLPLDQMAGKLRTLCESGIIKGESRAGVRRQA